MGRRLNACSGFWRGIFHSPTTLSLLLPRQGFYHDRFVLSPHFGSDRAISLPLFSGRRVFSLSPCLSSFILAGYYSLFSLPTAALFMYFTMYATLLLTSSLALLVCIMGTFLLEFL